MQYEVFIPAAEEDGFDVTIQVEASNWTQALKAGLERLGEGMVRNVMCDIKSDNSIHVTDATSQRVFIIRELEAQADAEPEPPQAATVKMEPLARPEPEAKPEAKPEPKPEPKVEVQPEPKPEPKVEVQPEPKPEPKVEAKPEPKPEPKVEAKPEPKPEPKVEAKPEPEPEPEQWQSDDGKMRISSSTFETLQREDVEEKPRVISESRNKTDERSAVSIGRTDEKVAANLIEDVFLEIQAIHENNMALEDVVNFVMDMVMEKLNAESGSILFADVNGRELYFAAARGPKADEIMSFRVPMGQGIVGFCAREGVSLAISDVHQDPRFYKEISESLGYETTSLACSPVQFEGRVYGAIEVINKKGASSFAGQEISAMAYIGRQLAEFIHELIMAREKIEG
ncbi:GAF domain-containing protein [Lujinxingia vulgaris]|uniref:GAF domain-containing protein n=1 Tax=Lujinxingia vulgaris TaxID=2600176 RepID=A0A5C6XE17_9DELT|nr:GAF domain-containing protein [Lujinxingia vulgaris]TXD38049.1 GAF domain-containing protein [Lujinxingia vulgaris]